MREGGYYDMLTSLASKLKEKSVLKKNGLKTSDLGNAFFERRPQKKISVGKRKQELNFFSV
jgi:hypothetical protein